MMTAGAGEPVLLVHGLGATKGSFLPTVAALAGSFRTIALDLPGFGDSCKPLGARYHPPFFARAVVELMDALGIERAHVDRQQPRRARRAGDRPAPSRARGTPGAAGTVAGLATGAAVGAARARAESGARPRAGHAAVDRRGDRPPDHSRCRDGSWVRAGVDEFLRAYLTPRGRVAFYAAARQIYLEEPHGAKGFWTRLGRLEPPALFIWGKHDGLVPIAFAAHVRGHAAVRASPRARLRSRAADRTPGGDARGDRRLPAERRPSSRRAIRHQPMHDDGRWPRLRAATIAQLLHTVSTSLGTTRTTRVPCPTTRAS